ncbi:SIS domain-containing protein [Jannaschia marina]|uniref:SIS domain-containing protein n=1 Tax=Jannaschia marina TaxID=2741674 RepID=UPI0015C717EE|nr:SIS domain-containing protein [Jannaschia marina]
MTGETSRKETVAALQGAADSVRDAAALGRKLAKDIDRIYFVACGAPNRSMLALEYWIQHYSPSLEVRRYFPAEFMTQETPRLDDRTLVVMGSKSGTTKETVEGAVYFKDTPAITVGFTTTEDKPLAQAVDHAILTTEAERDIVGLPHTSMAIAMMGFMGGLLGERDGWELEEKLLSSLEALPEAAAESKISNEDRATEHALALKDDKTIYHVASGPMFCTAYVFGVCTLMEMQWLNSTPLEGAEFFHGPFEVMDKDVPFFLLLGEDPSRPLMERVVRFSEKYGKRLFIYDSKDYEMPGIAPEVRAIVAPYIIGVALDRIGELLAEHHDHPLETRRYMWKVDY